MLLIFQVANFAAVVAMARSFRETSRVLLGRKTVAGCIAVCLQNQADIDWFGFTFRWNYIITCSIYRRLLCSTITAFVAKISRFLVEPPFAQNFG